VPVASEPTAQLELKRVSCVIVHQDAHVSPS